MYKKIITFYWLYYNFLLITKMIMKLNHYAMLSKTSAYVKNYAGETK